MEQVQKQVAAVHNEPFSTWLGSKRKYRACKSAKINWKSHRSLIKNPLRLISRKKKKRTRASVSDAEKVDWTIAHLQPRVFTLFSISGKRCLSCLPRQQSHASLPLKTVVCLSTLAMLANHHFYIIHDTPGLTPQFCITVVPNGSFVWREIRDL